MADSGNRKRASTEQDDNSSRKLPRNGGAPNVHLKILVPSNLAGGVLGKGGETIIRIQEESNIKAHMSKSSEYFPGSSDRICTLSGYDADGIKDGLRMVCDKLFEKMDSLQEKLTLKMLIPNATAGMIIGKGGEHIRSIKETTGAFVQLSRKNDLPERCITISGNKDDISKASNELVDMIAKDPLSGSCLSINYSSYSSDSGSTMNSVNTHRPAPFSEFNSNAFDFDYHRSAEPSFAFNFNASKSSGYPPSADAMDYLDLMLRNGGFRPQAVNEISNAMAVLIRYGVVDMSSKRSSLGSMGSSNPQSFSAFEGFNGSYSRMSDSNDIKLPVSFGEDEQGKFMSLQVSDSKVGSIMGSRGSTLTEIQQRSKAKVRVSKKEDFIDGTKDRIVYIYGGKKEMDYARSLIEWKLREFDAKNTKR